MATITGFTAARMQAIEDETIVSAAVVGGHLILTRHDGIQIDAGSVAGPTGATGPAGATSIVVATSTTRPAHSAGRGLYETDTKLFYLSDGTTWSLPTPQLPHTTTANVAAGAANTTSATFVAFSGALAVAAFAKLRDDTKLIVRFAGSVINDAALGQYEVAIQVNGVDHVVVNGFGNVGPQAGEKEITGLPKGSYTCTARRRRVNATGNVLDGVDTSARNCLTITETY